MSPPTASRTRRQPVTQDLHGDDHARRAGRASCRPVTRTATRPTTTPALVVTSVSTCLSVGDERQRMHAAADAHEVPAEGGVREAVATQDARGRSRCSRRCGPRISARTDAHSDRERRRRRCRRPRPRPRRTRPCRDRRDGLRRPAARRPQAVEQHRGGHHVDDRLERVGEDGRRAREPPGQELAAEDGRADHEGEHARAHARRVGWPPRLRLRRSPLLARVPRPATRRRARLHCGRVASSHASARSSHRGAGAALARARRPARTGREPQRHLPRARAADLLGARRRLERLGRGRQPLRRSRRRLRRRGRRPRAPARRRAPWRGRAPRCCTPWATCIRPPSRSSCSRRWRGAFPGGGAARAVLGSSGSDAVEAALKTALLATGRAGVVAFEGAYHGLTLGALDATWRPMFREPFRCAAAARDRLRALAATPQDVRRAARACREPVGAVLVEPIQGRGGERIPPHGFLRALRELCDARRLAADRRRGLHGTRSHGPLVRVRARGRRARSAVRREGASPRACRSPPASAAPR